MDPAALASDLDEPVVVGERAPARSPSNARSALGRRGRCWARRAARTRPAKRSEEEEEQQSEDEDGLLFGCSKCRFCKAACTACRP